MVLKYVLETGQEIHGPPYSKRDEAELYSAMSTVRTVVRSALPVEASPPAQGRPPLSRRQPQPARRPQTAADRPASEPR